MRIEKNINQGLVDLLVDPIPDSPDQPHKNSMADSEENY